MSQESLYRGRLGVLMLLNPSFGIPAAFYLFFAVAIAIFAVRSGLAAGSL